MHTCNEHCGHGQSQALTPNAPAAVATDTGPSRFLDAACTIARGLLKQAEPSLEGGLCWQGDELQTQLGAAANASQAHQVVRAPVGAGLYSGAAGIAWFLAHVGAHVQDDDMCQGALLALQAALSQAQNELAVPIAPFKRSSALSLYSGAAGVAWAAWQVGQRLQQPALQAQAVQLGAALAQLVLADKLPEELDLIGGLAGMAVALAALHREAGVPGAAPACLRLALRLMHTASDDAVFSSWPDPHAGSHQARHLCGLAHGASGMVWALWEAAQLAADTGVSIHSELMRGVRQGLAYERSWFAPATHSWPDLRFSADTAADRPPVADETTTAPVSMNAWCHGGIGITALRLHLYAHGPEPTLLAEAGAGLHGARHVVVAAQRSLAGGQSFDATLCHGLAGAAELYSLANQITGLADHARAAQRTGGLCLKLLNLTSGRWTCGLPGAQQAPGLMVGEAGIGAMLLRLHAPHAMPCILLPGARVQQVPDMASNSA
jgi:lantibiotic biosynthesis protein